MNLFKKNRYYLARGLVIAIFIFLPPSWKGYDRYPFDSIFIKNKGIHKENSKWNEDFETVECGAAPFGAMLLTKL